MAIVQTSYNERTASARLGQVATTSTCDIATYTCDESAGIDFGVAVRPIGTSGTQVQLGVGGDDSTPYAVTSFLGVAVRDITREQQNHPAGLSSVDKYVDGDIMTVLYRGDVWVTVESGQTVNAGQPVTVKEADGRFSARTAADAQHLVPGGSWQIGTTVAGGLALLRLNGEQYGG